MEQNVKLIVWYDIYITYIYVWFIKLILKKCKINTFNFDQIFFFKI